MKLSSAAKYFDRLTLHDAYNPTVKVFGQFGLFDDSTRDGSTVDRRVLSVPPSTTIPARRTLVDEASNITWLIGDVQPDYHDNAVIRQKFAAMTAKELAQVKSLDEALSAQAGVSSWGLRSWVKGSKEVDFSSDIVNVYDIYFAAGEDVHEGDLVYIDNRWHLVRSVYPSAAGFRTAYADELPEPVVVTATVTQREHIPTLDEYQETSTSVPAIRIRWQSFFLYPAKSATKFDAGDDVLVVRKASVSVAAGDTVTFDGATYNVVSVVDEGAVWAAHIRRD